jgi:hypothetical protein
VILEASANNKKVLNSLFKKNQTKFIDPPGVWRVELKHDNNLVLAKKFLVIPDPSAKNGENGEFQLTKEWQDNFKLFWTLDSMCVYRVKTTNSNLAFKSCEHPKSYWSSFYPDPKTNMTDMVQLNLDYRIF